MQLQAKAQAKLWEKEKANYFFKSCGCMAALCETVFTAAEFRNANGATGLLNRACAHDCEADVVVSEIIVQNKDRSKCVWTHELFFSSISSPFMSCLVPQSQFLSPDASSPSFLLS